VVDWLPSKSKQNQGKRLGFVCFSLAEMGLFKGLRRIQIKKPPTVQLALQVALWTRELTASSKALSPPRQGPGLRPDRGGDDLSIFLHDNL
jgi:hypothetical protein